MNEIEKLYENAGIEKRRCCFTECKYIYCNFCDDCSVADKMVYPPFTAEKQLELIKRLAKIGIKIDNKDGEFTFSIFGIISDFSPFEESLANLINNIWKNLTDDEKQQVKRILE